MVASRLGPLPRFFTIGKAEKTNLDKAMKTYLSGYVGGTLKGGYWVERLNAEWCETFATSNAIACNSATSGLLAAAKAAHIERGDKVWVTAYSMSATAAVLYHLGASVKFIDIEPDTYNLDILILDCIAKESGFPKAIFVTNLFGHPAHLIHLRLWCNSHGVYLIEDNAQAPFAKEYGKYAGTIGHIGIFSLNVHKHIQSGEGGVIVTDDPELAYRARLFINHGELVTPHLIGLNLRMTEPIAAIACAQLKKGPQIVEGRIQLAEAITECFRDCDIIVPPRRRPQSVHVYYMWAGRLVGPRPTRFKFVAALQARGIPMRLGYSRPLHLLYDTHDPCPVAETVDREGLLTFEICAFDPRARHLKKMRDIILQEASRLKGDEDDARTGSTAAA